ncbi:uncharacterized protein [Misgurnus anguillicaudatus]
MMGGVNVVLVLLVWTFTAVSEANIDIKIKCENVTAHVGDKITINCTVTYPNHTCSTVMYKFINMTAAAEQIFRKECRNDLKCRKLRRFSCPYTENKAMTTKLQFFLQANCGAETKEFSVSTTGASDRLTGEGFGESAKETFGLTAAIISVMCLIIIIMGLIYKKKLNFINTGFQKNYNMDVHEKILSKCSDRETV